MSIAHSHQESRILLTREAVMMPLQHLELFQCTLLIHLFALFSSEDCVLTIWER